MLDAALTLALRFTVAALEGVRAALESLRTRPHIDAPIPAGYAEPSQGWAFPPDRDRGD